MNRIKQAWLALTGQLKPEVREVEKVVEKVSEVLVGDAVQTIYVAKSRSLEKAYRGWINSCLPEPAPTPPDWEGMAFSSCADAFAHCGTDAKVEARECFVSGNTAWLVEAASKVELVTKRKVAKGRRG